MKKKPQKTKKVKADPSIICGNFAGYYLTSGKGNILLGDLAGFDLDTQNYMFCIGKNYTKKMTKKQYQALYKALKPLLV